MTRRFIVTHIDEDRETILAHDVECEEIVDVVVDDLMSSDALVEITDNEKDRRGALNAIASLSGLEPPHFRDQISIEGRTYRIEQLPDDPIALDEFYNARFLSPKLVKLVCRFKESKLRYTIYTKEPQHRGRPHCTASRGEKSANFEIPSGKWMVGDISPDSREATNTIRKHGERLLSLWHRTRPDDQKL